MWCAFGHWFLANRLALVLYVKSLGLGGCLNIYLPYCRQRYARDFFSFENLLSAAGRLIMWRLSICDWFKTMPVE
jgi:hypothetical protein